MQKIIIGITGLIGSGKSTVASFLEHHYDFFHLSFRSYLSMVLTKRGLDLTRENMRILANEIRRDHGADYILEEMLATAVHHPGNVVIESIRTVNEVSYLRNIGATLLAVNAPGDLRYQRIFKRGDTTDKVSYQEFLEGEERESVGVDPNVQNLPAVTALADYHIQNIDTADTEHQIRDILDQMSKR